MIIKSIEKVDPNFHLISVDEKTGIQALERYEERRSKSKGFIRRKEYEYKRHGTSTLIAAVNVEDGKLLYSHQGQTRDETDYCDFIKGMVNQIGELDEIVILADQLNTHMSKSLVLWIAQKEEYDLGELGTKGKSGILKDTESRRLFLETPFHRIRFVFTPKHCSWLNPIENWFAKLQRHVISNGNFTSVEDLETKIDNYIIFHNEQLAKPLRWKFKGFTKSKPFMKNNAQQT